MKNRLKDHPGEQKVVSITHGSRQRTGKRLEREATGREQDKSGVMALGIVLTFPAPMISQSTKYKEANTQGEGHLQRMMS